MPMNYHMFSQALISDKAALRLIWEDDLKAMAAQLGIPTPTLVLVEQPLPIFFVPSWQDRRGKAWAKNRIYIAVDVLACSTNVRRYLLAHELGHLVHHHTTKTIAGIISAALLSLIIWLRLPSLMFPTLCCFLFTGLCWRDYRENQADDVGRTLIGAAAMMEGIQEMGRITKTSNINERTRRLNRIAEGQQESRAGM
jgi:Zn-dependent protease with chaperone function